MLCLISYFYSLCVIRLFVSLLVCYFSWQEKVGKSKHAVHAVRAESARKTNNEAVLQTAKDLLNNTINGCLVLVVWHSSGTYMNHIQN